MGAHFGWRVGPRPPARSGNPGRKLVAQEQGDGEGTDSRRTISKLKQNGRDSTKVWGPIPSGLRGKELREGPGQGVE